MSDDPQYEIIQWFFPNQTLPRGGQAVTWIDLQGRQQDGLYRGQYLWVRDGGGYTIGADKVLMWRART